MAENGRIERVCVLLGGVSDEREISLRSGEAVGAALKKGGYLVTMVDAVPGYEAKLVELKPDMVFVALHGKGGEDGAVQHILEELDLPYVGSGAIASRNAFDKELAKAIFVANDIRTPSYVVLNRESWNEAMIGLLPERSVIKPTCNGSSIGVVMCEGRDELREAIGRSLERYDRILIEERIDGREFTVGIVGNEALPVIELRTKNLFYDFEAKYTKGLTEYLVPAPIDKKTTDTLQAMAEQTHQTLGLRDFSRVDFLVDNSGHPYVLEANNIPGFTETSLLPKAAKEAGVDFNSLCMKLVELASRRMRGVNV